MTLPATRAQALREIDGLRKTVTTECDIRTRQTAFVRVARALDEFERAICSVGVEPDVVGEQLEFEERTVAG